MPKPVDLSALAIEQHQAVDAVDAASIREAVVHVGDARELAGAEALASLEVLTLYGSKSLSLAGLAPLRRLRWLRVGAFALTGLDALASTSLEYLELSTHRQKTLDGLQAPSLRALWMWSGGLVALGDVHMPRLRRLDLRANRITNLDVLARLPSLRALDVSQNPIAEPAALLGAGGLRCVEPLDLRKCADRDVRDAVTQRVAPLVAERREGRSWGEAAVEDGWADADELGELSYFDTLACGAHGWRGAMDFGGLRVLRAGSAVDATAPVLPEVLRIDASHPSLAEAHQVLPALTRLRARGVVASLDALPPHESLRHLELDGARALRSFAGFERFPRLATVRTGHFVHPDAARLQAAGIAVYVGDGFVPLPAA